MLPRLINNREIGLDGGIRASHNGIDSGHYGLSCNSNIPLLKTSSKFDGQFTDTVSQRGEISFNNKTESQQHRPAASPCTLSK